MSHEHQLLHELMREVRADGIKTRGVVREVARQIAHELLEAIHHLPAKPATPTLGLSVTRVVGRNTDMAVKPIQPLELSDVERVQLALAPKLPDGSADPGPFTWETSDASVATIVGLDADGNPDESNADPTGPVVWALTPAGPGSVTITVTSASPNVDGNSIQLTITEGRTGDVNLSAGTPVSDL